jgi:hypothetical protein
VAALLALLTAAPVITFDLRHRDRSGQYFSRTTTLNSAQTVSENAARVWDQYRRFFSQSFLFERGDPLTRHSVPGFGELYWCMVPLLALGLLWCLWPRHPEGKLFLWWLVLYPVAPALMNEAPSASRGIIGAAAFCVVAAAGVVAVLETLRRLPWPRVALTLQAAAVAALVIVLGREAFRYAQVYTTVYPAQAADDFQYGYRETIAFMEKLRDQYDLMLLTANRVNQPQIFAAFYNAERPGGPPNVREHGYLIIDPAEYGRYEMNQRILAALREDDLRLFDDYKELHRVMTPAGKTEFVIAEPHTRRRFIREWLVTGPFDSTGRCRRAARRRDAGDAVRAQLRQRVGAGVLAPRAAAVRAHRSQRILRPQRRGGGQARRVAVCVCLHADRFALRTACLVGARRRPATDAGVAERQRADRKTGHRDTVAPSASIRLRAGASQLMVKNCKTTGDWFFTARITDKDGHDSADLTGARQAAGRARRPGKRRRRRS